MVLEGETQGEDAVESKVAGMGVREAVLMTCDCCKRELPDDAFGCANWCHDCSRGDCSPFKSGRQCPRLRTEHQRKIAVLRLRLVSVLKHDTDQPQVT